MGILEINELKLNLGGKPILNGLSMDIWEGHVHAVVGPNGAGKSTLASTIMGLGGYTDFEGGLTYEGSSRKGVSIDERARRGITLAWQEPARYEGLKIKSFLKAASGGNERIVDGVLDSVGMNPDDYRDRSLDKTLSGGERKKIELASILAMKPKVVILDEPDSGIDVASLNRIFDAVAEFRKLGSTVIMITHSLTVLRQADHAFLMCNGKIVDKGGIDRISRFFEEECIPCDHQNEPEKGEAA